MNDLKKLLENAGVKQLNEDEEWYVEDASGNGYAVFIETNMRDSSEQMFVDVNGKQVASATVGGGGLMNVSISNPDAVLEALYAFANNNDR